MAKALRCRPSEVLRISDEFTAYAFDSAVVLWGSSFDAAIADAAREAKNPEEADRRVGQILRRWIPSQRRYASVKK